jgi:50S ribosomal protein L16 3-hydroxylase
MLINFNIEKETFKKEFLYKTPYIFKKSFDSNLFKWNQINEIYSRGDISHRDFKVMNGYEVPKEEYVETYNNLGVIEHKCITSALYKYLRNGATLVRNRIKNEPLIDNISRQIGIFAESRTITGGYAAFSSKSSYKSHWDTRDVYAVQLLGRKRWILKKPNFEFPLYMQQTKNFSGIKEPEDIYMDIILEAGDILYIPRGWWHDPLPLDDETFHLAIATFPPNGFEYIQWLENIAPNLLDCRKNLSNFEESEEILTNISDKLPNLIKDKRYYDLFMMSHLENHYIPSTLSLDVLGNNKVDRLDPSQKLCLNTNVFYLFDETFIIANGNKVNLDDVSLKLIKFLAESPYSSVKDICAQFDKELEEKINKLLFELSIENIIGLIK